MKNLFLLALLLGLIGIAYYSEEVYKKSENEKALAMKIEKVSLLKTIPNNFTGFETKNYTLEKQQEWMVTNLSYPASEQMIEELRSVLRGLHIVGVVEDEKSSELFDESYPFALSVGENKKDFVLGEVSEITGHFYLKTMENNKPVIYVCKDESQINVAYKDELDLNLKKYIRLRALMQGQRDLFIQRALFYQLKVNKLHSIIIDNKHNRRFQINLEQNTTEPVIFKGLKYKNFNDFLTTVFSKARIKKIKEENQKILSNLASEIIFHHDEKKSIAKLYKGLNENYGYFVKFEDLDYVYEIDEEAAEIFLINVSDLWDKKIFYDLQLTSKDKFSYRLSFDDKKYYNFEVSDINTFKIESQSSEVHSFDQNYMNLLFNLVLNLVDFKQANYVENFQMTDIPNDSLYIQLFQKKLALRIKPLEIEVYDFSTQLKHIFKYSTETLGLTNWQQIFTLNSI